MITSYYASVKCITKFKMFCSVVYFSSVSSPVLVIFMASMPYLCVGTLFCSSTLFGSLSFTSHEVDAFIGIFMFEGDWVFPRVSSFSSFVTGLGLVSSLPSFAVELISIIGGIFSFEVKCNLWGVTFLLLLLGISPHWLRALCRLSWLFQLVSLVFCSSCYPFCLFAPPWQPPRLFSSMPWGYWPFPGSSLVCGLTHSPPFRFSF